MRELFQRVLRAGVEAYAASTILQGSARELYGVRIVVHRSDAEHTTACFRVLDAALALLARHAPGELAVLRQEVSLVLVWPVLKPSVGRYVPEARRIELLCDHVADAKSPIPVAMTLVHEATHAQLRVPPGAAALPIAEEERRCAQAEARFARRVPGGAPYAAVAKRQQHRTAAFYDREARVTRALDALDADLPAQPVLRPFFLRVSAWVRRRVRGTASDPSA